MRLRSFSIVVMLLSFVVAPIPAVNAITIDVDFQSGTLFSSLADAQAKAAINQAAADLSAAITSSLNAVATDTYVGTNGFATVTFDWNADYDDPDSSEVFPVSTATLAADTVKIYVGTTNLGGSALGVGGPHIGVEVGVSYSPTYPEEWPAAATDAAAQSTAAYTRGAGPIMGTLSGGGEVGGVYGTYSADYGVAFGSLWFDVDENNDGNTDSSSSLDDYWHWRHDTSVTPGENDLYSVALHEMIHVLGIGTSTTWDNNVSGTTWTGAEVQAITGSGAGLIASDGSHIAPNVMSPRISDGTLQEVVMDPNIITGTRKELTAVDLAFLRDLGYETITPVIPDPPDFDGDGDVDGDDLAYITDNYGLGDGGDANEDGLTNGEDFLAWQRQYTGALATSISQVVPEPGSLALLASAGFLLGLRRFRRKGRRTL